MKVNGISYPKEVLKTMRDHSVVVDSEHTRLCGDIICSQKLADNPKYAKILNESNMSALDNFVRQNNAVVYIDELHNDLFDDTVIEVHKFKRGEYPAFSNVKLIPMNLKNTADDFVSAMRDIYKNVEVAIKELSR